MMNTKQQAKAAFQQQQAVVIGSGKAGLLSARVLSEHFEQVTIIERQLLYANSLFLEEHMRKDAACTRGNVRIIDNCDVTGIGVLDDRIAGVYLRYREEEPFKKLFQADFVVDASGRNSLTPQWLAFLGYGSVEESSVNFADGGGTTSA